MLWQSTRFTWKRWDEKVSAFEWSFFLNVFDMYSSLQLNVNLHVSDTNLTWWLLYDVANANDCLHIKFSRIFYQINELVFNWRENDVVTTCSCFAMNVHFLQNTTITRDVNIIRKYINAVHKVNRDNSTKPSLQKFQKINIVKQIQNWKDRRILWYWKEIVWDSDSAMIEATAGRWKIVERRRKRT